MIGSGSTGYFILTNSLSLEDEGECILVRGPEPSLYPGYSSVQYKCRSFPSWPIIRFIPSVVSSQVPNSAPCAPGFPHDMMPRTIPQGVNGQAWRECHFRD